MSPPSFSRPNGDCCLKISSGLLYRIFSTWMISPCSPFAQEMVGVKSSTVVLINHVLAQNDTGSSFCGSLLRTAEVFGRPEGDCGHLAEASRQHVLDFLHLWVDCATHQ